MNRRRRAHHLRPAGRAQRHDLDDVRAAWRTCWQAAATEDGVRVVVMRGVGGKAFIAGTDIAQFQKSSPRAEDGVAYEASDRSAISQDHRGAADADTGSDRGLRGGRRACHRGVLRSARSQRPARASVCRSRARSAIAWSVAELRAAGRAALSARRGRRKPCCCWPRTSPPTRRWLAGSLLEIVQRRGDRSLASTEFCDRLTHHAPITMRVTKRGDPAGCCTPGLPDTEDLSLRQTLRQRGFQNRRRRRSSRRRPPQWRGR